jgi:hypothetical protein
MTERTPLEQAKFDAAELINQAQTQATLPPTENVVLRIQNVKVGSKSRIKGDT